MPAVRRDFTSRCSTTWLPARSQSPLWCSDSATGRRFFTFCQASREQKAGSQCTLVRRDRAGENAADDLAWQKVRGYGEEFYGARTQFVESAADALKACADSSIDLLLLDDCDSANEVRADLASWEAKLSPGAVVLLHGLDLERADRPKDAWKEWIGGRPSAEMPDGIGLGIAARSRPSDSEELLQALFGGEKALGELVAIYRVAAVRINAQTQVDQALREQATLETRQVWLDSLLADRWKVQGVMDYQAQAIRELEQKAEALFTDRTKAQLVMDSQQEQVKHWVAETERLTAKVEKLKTQLNDQKAILSAAKKACRKKGRCFQVPAGAERAPSACGKNPA